MEVRFLKILLYIVLLLLLFGGYELSSDIWSDVEEIKEVKTESTNQAAVVSKDSVLSLMGLSADEVKQTYGPPARIDPSRYGYEWWVYNQTEDTYFQVGIKNKKVVTVYAMGDAVNMSPFYVKQRTTEIVKQYTIQPHISVRDEQTKYEFEVPEKEMYTNPLVPFGEGYYAILYLDQFLNELSSVRVVDVETLLMLRPYSVVYQGPLKEVPNVNQEKQLAIDEANKKQIFDQTNIIRKRHGLDILKWNEGVAKVALGHSEDMKNNQYFDHVSPSKGDLSMRLNDGNVKYRMAGENIAAKYIDAPAAVNGWLNSEGHRKAMLSLDFEEIGVGVDDLYYTQNFITK